MNDRDELRNELTRNLPDWLRVDRTLTGVNLADALWSAGWRKKPSKNRMVGELVNAEIYRRDTDGTWGVPLTEEAERIADAILALLDGPTGNGES